MDSSRIIGKIVRERKSNMIGVIVNVDGSIMKVSYNGNIVKYIYPSALVTVLELEDEDILNDIYGDGINDEFNKFIIKYKNAMDNEIKYIKSQTSKKYYAIDGKCIMKKNTRYVYVFDTDVELNFPTGTEMRILLNDRTVLANVLSCEEYMIMFYASEYIGNKLDEIEFTVDNWRILEELNYRIAEMTYEKNEIAYEVACMGKTKINRKGTITLGSKSAIEYGCERKITFIWGPPGTGKTETLSEIAKKHIENGKRVLMLSYSNVSVDEALLRVAAKVDYKNMPGKVLRYGYPKRKELIESVDLNSYQYVLSKNENLYNESKNLKARLKKIKMKTEESVKIIERLVEIRIALAEAEKQLILSSIFLATTISKAIVDKAVYMQSFDVVIFDEASMAYVPQIVFASSIAKSHFICMGDFKQLPAIVQNNEEIRLQNDIFEYTGITQAVEEGYAHEWLVMLDMQYRMHNEIADFVSRHMYSGMLKTSDRQNYYTRSIALEKPMREHAISMIDLTGVYSVCISTMDFSRVNIMSAMLSIRIALDYIDRYDVGIITPYSAQARIVQVMLRDLSEKDSRIKKILCATVHQFQGSQKDIIIYDAVDCFHMAYPGSLLTSSKNNLADRLFNVAVTRARGKFVLIANKEFFERKKISGKLMFSKYIDMVEKNNANVDMSKILEEFGGEYDMNGVYMEDTIKSWKFYIDDLKGAVKKIYIDIPDIIQEDDKKIEELVEVCHEKIDSNVQVKIRREEDNILQSELEQYVDVYKYITNPVTIIDDTIVWFGQPLSDAGFITEGEYLLTKYHPCFRIESKHVPRLIKALLRI